MEIKAMDTNGKKPDRTIEQMLAGEARGPASVISKHGKPEPSEPAVMALPRGMPMHRAPVQQQVNDPRQDQTLQRLRTALPGETPHQKQEREALLQEYEKRRLLDDLQRRKGRRNIYVCGKCYGVVVTCDINKGATPHMMACIATEGCDGAMQSSMYHVFDQRMRYDFEWYKPDEAEMETLRPSTQDFVNKGGLMIRPAQHLRDAIAAMNEPIDSSGQPDV
jgi:hypothetical protein